MIQSSDSPNACSRAGMVRSSRRRNSFLIFENTCSMGLRSFASTAPAAVRRAGRSAVRSAWRPSCHRGCWWRRTWISPPTRRGMTAYRTGTAQSAMAGIRWRVTGKETCRRNSFRRRSRLSRPATGSKESRKTDGRCASRVTSDGPSAAKQSRPHTTRGGRHSFTCHLSLLVGNSQPFPS